MGAIPGFRERDLAEQARPAARRELGDVRGAIEQGLAFDSTVNRQCGAVGAQAVAGFGNRHADAEFGFQCGWQRARSRGAGGKGEQGEAAEKPAEQCGSGGHGWLAWMKGEVSHARQGVLRSPGLQGRHLAQLAIQGGAGDTQFPGGGRNVAVVAGDGIFHQADFGGPQALRGR